MSQSNMSGLVSDEQDSSFILAFPESMTASEYLKWKLPNDGDRMFFGYNEETDEWVQFINVKGKLWVEIGEAAA